MGGRPRSSTPAEFRTFVRVEIDRWARSSRAPGPGRSDAVIALGSTTRAGDPASAGPGQRLQLPSKRVDAKRSRSRGCLPPCSSWNSRRTPCSHRYIHTTSSRSSRAAPARWDTPPWVPGPCITPAHSRDMGPWWRAGRSELFHDTCRLRNRRRLRRRRGTGCGADRNDMHKDRHHPLPIAALRGLASACRDRSRAAGRPRGIR